MFIFAVPQKSRVWKHFAGWVYISNNCELKHELVVHKSFTSSWSVFG